MSYTKSITRSTLLYLSMHKYDRQGMHSYLRSVPGFFLLFQVFSSIAKVVSQASSYVDIRWSGFIGRQQTVKPFPGVQAIDAKENWELLRCSPYEERNRINL
jgi:hypothetical protein